MQLPQPSAGVAISDEEYSGEPFGPCGDGYTRLLKPEQWTAVINTNLGSLFNMTRQVRGPKTIIPFLAVNTDCGPIFLEFNFFKEHTSSGFGGVPMPLTGAISEGRSFFCPHCGALYAMTYLRLSNRDSNVAKCVVCGQIMDRWDSTKVPSFKLVHRPDDY
jgi:hypothetical protein